MNANVLFAFIRVHSRRIILPALPATHESDTAGSARAGPADRADPSLPPGRSWFAPAADWAPADEPPAALFHSRRAESRAFRRSPATAMRPTAASRPRNESLPAARLAAESGWARFRSSALNSRAARAEEPATPRRSSAPRSSSAHGLA